MIISTTKIDKNRRSDINIDYKIIRQKTIKWEVGFKFIRIDPE